MRALEEITEKLDSTESKKNTLRKSIFSLVTDWREVEKDWESTQKSVQHYLSEHRSGETSLPEEAYLVMKEKELKERESALESEKGEVAALERLLLAKLREVGLKEERLEAAEKEKAGGAKLWAPLMEDREKALEMKEKEVALFREDLELKEKDIGMLIDLSHKREKELGTREKQLEVRRKFVEELESDVKSFEEELESKRKHSAELDSSAKSLKKEMKAKRKDLKELESSVKSLEEELGAKMKDFSVAEHGLLECQSKKELLESGIKELEGKVKGLKELEVREKELNLKEKQCRSEKESLESGKKELEVKMKEFEVREKLLLKRGEKELEVKMKGMKELEVREKQLELKEKKFRSEKELLERGKELEVKMKGMKEFEVREKELLERGKKELEVKMKGMKEFEVREMELLERGKELEVKMKRMKEFEVREKQLEFKEKQCRSEKELLERGKKDLEQKGKEFEAQVKASEIKEVELRRRDLDQRNCALKEIEVREKKLKAKERELEEVTQERLKEWQSKQKQCQSDNKALDLRMKEFEDRIKAFETREKEFELKEKLNDGFSLVVELVDGKDVNIVLNGIKIDVSSPNEVSKALRLSGDPVHLVLSAMEVLNPPYLMKEDMRFEGNVGRSCLLLLEQLIIISPTIQSQQKQLALKLAAEWKDKISLGNSLEVLAFLYLLASFDLASSFYAEEILELFETIAVSEHDRIPKLCHRLGLKDKISVSKSCNVQHRKEDVGTENPNCPMSKSCNNLDQKDDGGREIPSSSGSKSCYDQDEKENGGRENPNCPGSDLIVEAQGIVEVAQEENLSTDVSKCLKGCEIDPGLSNTLSGTSEPMAIIIANMNSKNLFSFLNLHCPDHPFLQNEVIVALEISRDPAKLVLDTVECFYRSYPQELGSRSCILLLDQLMRISPLNLKDVRETAQRIALDWKAKIIAGSKNALANLVFLIFVSAFRMVTAFDFNELLQLYNGVSEQKSFGIPEVIYGVVYSQLESQKIKTEAMQLEVKSPISDIAPKKGELKINMESDESQIPMFLKHSSDAAELVLDALDFSNYSDSKEKKASVVKSFYYLLKQLASVSPKIESCTRKRASKFALDWKSKLTDSNSWEVFAFLQYVGVYGLFSSFGAKYTMGLLEVHPHLVKEASGIIRMFKLEHKAPGFTMSLIAKKQRLIAFEYVYEFNLVDKIPPVALLKKHILDSKLASQKCKKEQRDSEALDGAISDEISTLKDVIKCVLDRSLESEYSPDMLRERITCLEVERKKLKKCVPADRELNPKEKEQFSQERTRKRPASDPEPAPVKEQIRQERTRKRPACDPGSSTPPSKKLRHKNKFSKAQSSLNTHPFEGEGTIGRYPVVAAFPPISLSSVAAQQPALTPQQPAPIPQQLALQFVTGDGRVNRGPYYDHLVPPTILFAPTYQ